MRGFSIRLRPTILAGALILVSLPDRGAADDEKEAKLTKASESIQGEWLLLSVQRDGMPPMNFSKKGDKPDDKPVPYAVEGCLLKVTEGKIEFHFASVASGHREVGAVEVTRVGAKSMDVDVTAKASGGTDLGSFKDEKEWTRKEVWQVDGDRLIRCMPKDHKDSRPTGVESKKGDGVLVWTFVKRRTAK